MFKQEVKYRECFISFTVAFATKSFDLVQGLFCCILLNVMNSSIPCVYSVIDNKRT